VTAERIAAMAAFKEVDNRRHAQAEYVAYLEGEHATLSARIHQLEAEVNAPAKVKLRRMLGRIKRRTLG
jgi:hypothetical protein